MWVSMEKAYDSRANLTPKDTTRLCPRSLSAGNEVMLMGGFDTPGLEQCQGGCILFKGVGIASTGIRKPEKGRHNST